MSRGTLMGLLTRGSGGKTPAASLGAQSTHPKAAAPDPGPVSCWAHVGPRGIVWSVLRLCQAFGPLGFPEKMQLCPHPHPRPQGAPRGGCAPCALWPGVGVCLGEEGTQEGLRTERAGKENDRLTSGAVVSRGGRAWPGAFARLARVWPPGEVGASRAEFPAKAGAWFWPHLSSVAGFAQRPSASASGWLMLQSLCAPVVLPWNSRPPGAREGDITRQGSLQM